MIFYTLTSVMSHDCRWNLSMKIEGFTSPRGLENVNIEVKHVSYLLSDYCIKSFLARNFWTKKFLKFSFCA